MTFRSAVLPCAIALAVSCGGSEVDNDPVAVTGGRVQGQLLDQDIRVFRGIPYARPPLGNFRWRPPEGVVPWEGIRDATAYGAECPQGPLPPTSIYARPEQPQSEDCLFLNVWAPPPGSAPFPVLVWIHGGDLTRGSGASDFGPDGSSIPFTRKGIVVVSLNHRLGALGYLAHPELSAESPQKVSGNYGLLDQIAALEWVRDNIAAFGGDPARVTIAGQSGGAESVSALIASPLARGLFARAVGQSGRVFMPGVFLRDGSEGRLSAEASGLAFTREVLGVAPEESLRALRSAPTDAVLRTSFVPRETVDGWVLPDQVHTMIRERRHNSVPVIVGSNADEATALVGPAFVPGTMDIYRERIAARYGASVGAFERVYPVESESDIRPAMLAAMRDATFTLPARTWARLTTDAGSTAYLYFFNHRTPGPRSAELGAFHGSEIPYVFDALRSADPEGAGVAYTSVDHELAERASTYWANFIIAGNPNSDGLPEWSAYERNTEPYLLIGDTIQPGTHLLTPQLDFLEGLAGPR